MSIERHKIALVRFPKLHGPWMLLYKVLHFEYVWRAPDDRAIKDFHRQIRDYVPKPVTLTQNKYGAPVSIVIPQRFAIIQETESLYILHWSTGDRCGWLSDIEMFILRAALAGHD